MDCNAEEDFQQHAARLLGPDQDVVPSDEPFESLAFIDSRGEVVPIVQKGEDDLLPRVLTSAMRAGASDIHIEPGNDAGRIRLRVDGKMLPVDEDVRPQRLQQMASRIKVMRHRLTPSAFSPCGNRSLNGVLVRRGTMTA